MSDYPAGISHRRRIPGVAHWRWQRFSAVVVLCLMAYFVILLAAMGGQDYAGATALVAASHNALALALLVIAGLFHGAMGLQVVIEDYVSIAGGRNGIIRLVNIVMLALGAGTLWAIASIAL